MSLRENDWFTEMLEEVRDVMNVLGIVKVNEWDRRLSCISPERYKEEIKGLTINVPPEKQEIAVRFLENRRQVGHSNLQ